jgi:hypothetical protein
MKQLTGRLAVATAAAARVRPLLMTALAAAVAAESGRKQRKLGRSGPIGAFGQLVGMSTL